MSSNWKIIKKTVKEDLVVAAAMTKKYYKISKVKLDLMNMNNSMNDAYREMGIEVYKQITEEIKGDIRLNANVKSLVEKVNQLKQFIKDKELKIEGIKKESVPQTKTVRLKTNSLMSRLRKRLKSIKGV